MSRISAHSSRHRRGFTLVELLVGVSISAIVIGGVLAAYTFLGRNLGRLVNLEHQQLQSRRALKYFTQDLSTASSITTATVSSIVMTKPLASSTATITYVYDSGTLTRYYLIPPATVATPTIMLQNLTSFSFKYYNSSGTEVTSSPQSVKTAEFIYASAEGSNNGYTRTTFSSVSPRVVVRNKPLLQ
jgi:prepilin-type N-terminal cleavage/methylation domain-containing protein